MIEPRLEGYSHRVVRESLRTTQTLASVLTTDLYGNTLRRLVAPGGLFSFDFAATIETAPNAALRADATEVVAQDLPTEALIYTMPSRYCPSDTLARMASGEFGQLPPGGSRVLAVAEWLRTRIAYEYGTTDACTAADAVIVGRRGVCRDFAHSTIALCRALGIPARYASGYCLELDPPDFHAWTQVWLRAPDGKPSWFNVDATFDGLRPALVPIAHGRDAADVSMLTSTAGTEFRAQSVQVQAV